METLKTALEDIISFMRRIGLAIDPIPQIMTEDEFNDPDDIFIRTGHYDAKNNMIVLNTSNRHIKDILRTFCHELYHHHQFLENPERFQNTDMSGTVYSNEMLKNLEGEAYLKGNLLFRYYTEYKQHGSVPKQQIKEQQQDSDDEFIREMNADTVKNMISNIPNDSRTERISKTFNNGMLEYCAICTKNGKPKSISALNFRNAGDNHCLIDEIVSFHNGSGAELIDNVIREYRKVWLMASPDYVGSSDSYVYNEKLAEYYRKPEFGFVEYRLDESIWKCPVSFFMTKDCDDGLIRKYIDDNFR